MGRTAVAFSGLRMRSSDLWPEYCVVRLAALLCSLPLFPLQLSSPPLHLCLVLSLGKNPVSVLMARGLWSGGSCPLGFSLVGFTVSLSRFIFFCVDAFGR